MPIVKRQSNVATKPSDILSRIAPIEQDDKGMTMALYGKSGSGKTRFAGTWPKPLLLIGAEDGTRSIRKDPGIDFVRLLDSLEMEPILTALKNKTLKSKKWGGLYNSVVLDTGTMLQDLILKEICGLEKLPETRSWGVITGDQYKACNSQTKEYFRWLLSLKDIGINICIICQERNFKDETDKSGEDMLLPSVGSALSPKVAEWLHPACENVCQMYIRKEYKITKTWNKLAKRNVVTRTPTGKMEYCLRTEEHDLYASKVRVPRGQPLPKVIIDPTFDDMLRLVNGEYEVAE